MSFAADVSALDAQCLAEFGTAANGVGAIFQPQGGLPVMPVTGIIKPPAFEEQFQPGGADGVSVIRFFVRLIDFIPLPQIGDTLLIGGVNYDIANLDVDAVGGATLKLRRNA